MTEQGPITPTVKTMQLEKQTEHFFSVCIMQMNMQNKLGVCFVSVAQDMLLTGPIRNREARVHNSYGPLSSNSRCSVFPTDDILSHVHNYAHIIKKLIERKDSGKQTSHTH